MNNYDYLTEHDKSIFGYIEDVPSEHEPIDEAWSEEEVNAIEELNAIFNL